MKRLYVDDLEKIKKFDAFISHNSQDEDKIVTFYKKLNKEGYVAYIDWVNDKFDLKRQWCNASTVLMATLDGNTKTLLPVSELPCILSLIQ